MAILGLLLVLPWFTPHPYTETVPGPDGWVSRSKLWRALRPLDPPGWSGYGWLWIHRIFLSYSHGFHSIKKGHIYINIWIWIYIYSDYSGNDRNMARTFCCPWYSQYIFLSFPMLDPQPTLHLAALHVRLGAPTLGPRRSMEITTNRIAIVTVFNINSRYTLW